MAETLGIVVSSTAFDCDPLPSNWSALYDDKFVLRDTSGHAIAHAKYAMQRESGDFEYGEADSNGHTHLLSIATVAEKIRVYLAG